MKISKIKLRTHLHFLCRINDIIKIRMDVRKAIFPLYIVSKLLCTCPFSLKTLRPSLFGSVVTICQAIGYTFFHLWMVNHDMSTDSAKNLIRQLIDSYNRYSGFCAFCFLVITSMWNQAKIVSVIRNVEVIDQIFEKKLDTPIDNRTWRRYVQLTITFITILNFNSWILFRTAMSICKFAFAL